MTGKSQWKNCCYWLILKKAELTNIFLGIFLLSIYFQEIWIFCILNVYLFLQMLFKKKNLREFNFVKLTKILNIHEKYTRKIYYTSGRHSPNPNPMTSSNNKNNILKAILAPWYREWLIQWKHLNFTEMKVFVFSVRSF